MKIHVIAGTIESWQVTTTTNGSSGIKSKANKISIIEDNGRTTVIENLRAHECFDRICPGEKGIFIIASSMALWGKVLMCAKINGVEFLSPQVVRHRWMMAYLICLVMFILGIPLTFFLVGVPMIIGSVVLSITNFFSIGVIKEVRDVAKSNGFSLLPIMQENIRKI